MLKKRRKRKQNKTKHGQKIIKYIYMKFAEEKTLGLLFFFFCKVIGYKSENKRNTRGLKIFLKN